MGQTVNMCHKEKWHYLILALPGSRQLFIEIIAVSEGLLSWRWAGLPKGVNLPEKVVYEEHSLMASGSSHRKEVSG